MRKPRIYVVEAEKDGELQYWAAAIPPEDAARAVQQQLGAGWHARLTERVLDSEYEGILDVPPGRVRRIKHMKPGSL